MGYFSNGSEGGDYEARYCDRCLHQKLSDDGCAVWQAHLLYNYEGIHHHAGRVLNVLIPRLKDGGNGECRMFIER